MKARLIGEPPATPNGRRRYLPYVPLAEFLTASYGSNHSAWARALDLDRTNLLRKSRSGRLILETGERYAHTLGCHPAEIWSDYYEVVAEGPQ